MIKRALAICSTYRQLSTEFKKIRKIGCSKSFIDTLIGVNLTQHLNNNDNDVLAPAMTMNDQAIVTATKFNENNKKCIYDEIPFIGDSTTHAMKRKILHRQFSHSLRTRIPL